MLSIVFRATLSLVLLVTSINVVARDDDKTNYSESLPPVLPYALQSSVMELIELNFFLHHSGSQADNKIKNASKKYRNLKKFIEKNSDKLDALSLSRVKSRFDRAVGLYHYYAVRNASDRYSAQLLILREFIYKSGEWIFFKEKNTLQKSETRILYLASGLNQASYVSEVLPKLAQSLDEAPKKYLSSLHTLVYFQLKSSPNTEDSIRDLLKRKVKLNTFERQLSLLIDVDRDLSINSELKNDRERQQLHSRLYKISLGSQKIRNKSIVGAINQSLMYLWSKVNATIDWRKSPLFEVQNRTPSLHPAILERMALDEVREGKIQPAIASYLNLSTKFKGTPNSIKLDLRYLHLSRLLSRKTGNKFTLAKAHQSLELKYKRPEKSIKKLSRAMRNKVFLSYRRMIESELFDAIDGEQSTKVNIKNVAGLSEGFIKTYPNNKKVRPVKARLAQFYTKFNLYSNALPLYKFLAIKEPLLYYPKAISVQKKIAGWPETPPWSTKVTPKVKSEISKLAGIFESYIESKKKSKDPIKWEELGHLGLIYRVLGQWQKIENLWIPYIKRGNVNPDVNSATGLILANQYGQKRWSDFIDFARDSEKLNIVPSLDGQVVDMSTFYRIALSNRAKIYLSKNKLKEAEKDYQDLVKRYKGADYGPGFLLSLARVKQARGQTLSAKKKILSLAQQYPTNTLVKGAILMASEWSDKENKKRGWEVNEELYAFFMMQFPQDQKIPYIRYERSKVLISLKKPKRASALLYDHALDKRAPMLERVRSALTHINLEERYGEVSQSLPELLPIIKQVRISYGEENFVLAHVILSKDAVERKDVEQMKKYEIVLKPYLKKYQDAAEALGMLRFTLVEMKRHQVPFSNVKYELGKYRPRINEIIAKFKLIKDDYESVCLPAYNRYCETVYNRLTHFSQDAIDSVRAVELKGSAQPKIIKALENFQLEKIGEIEEEKERIEELAEKFKDRNLENK